MTSFMSLANFEAERFPPKLVFGEATQVFQGDLMESYLQVLAIGKHVESSIAALSINHFQFSFHIHAHGQIVPWVSSCNIWERYS